MDKVICGNDAKQLMKREPEKTYLPTLRTNFLTRKERLEALSSGILRRYEVDFGIPAMTEKIEILTSKSWEQHLTEEQCPPQEYDNVYSFAVKIYREEGFGKGPFNVLYLLEAWNRIRFERTREARLPRSQNSGFRQLKPALPCDMCLGTTIDYNRDETGKWLGVKYVKTEKGSMPADCPKCRGGNDGEQESTQT